MDYEDYKRNALRTEGIPKDLGMDNNTLISALRVGAAAGQLLDKFKRIAIYRKKVEPEVIEQAILSLQAQLAVLFSLVKSTTDNSTGLYSPNIRLTHGAVGMFTESGELLEAVIKSMETNTLDLTNIGEETGDSDWYKMIIHDVTGVSEGQSRAKNIAKLKARYGEKFSTEAALVRDLGAERVVLAA